VTNVVVHLTLATRCLQERLRLGHHCHGLQMRSVGRYLPQQLPVGNGQGRCRIAPGLPRHPHAATGVVCRRLRCVSSRLGQRAVQAPHSTPRHQPLPPCHGCWFGGGHASLSEAGGVEHLVLPKLDVPVSCDGVWRDEACGVACAVCFSCGVLLDGKSLSFAGVGVLTSMMHAAAYPTHHTGHTPLVGTDELEHVRASTPHPPSTAVQPRA